MRTIVRDDRLYFPHFHQREEDFELVVTQQLGRIAPDFWTVPFKTSISQGFGTMRRPDLALIHRNYNTWGVIEVEIESHPLTQHVYPQVEVFANGDYTKSHCDYLCSRITSANPERLSKLIQYSPPHIIVVVNSRSVESKWSILTRDLGVELAFLEVFRSDNDDVIFEFSGFLPESSSARLCTARMSPLLNALEIRNTDSIKTEHGSEVTIYLHDRPYTFLVLKTADVTQLFPRQTIDLQRKQLYEIAARSGRLHLDTL